MTDTDDASGSAPASIAAQPFNAGAALREARIRLGMNVADVANHLKFAPRQIEALENNDFAQLPEMTFVRGFVRSYARLLQLDPVPLLAALPGMAAQPAPATPATQAEVPFPNTYAARKPNIIWLAAALVVAVALALFTLLHSSEPKAPHVETLALPDAPPVLAVPDEEIKSQVAAPKTQQAAQPLAQPVTRQVATNSVSKQAAMIRLVFDEESWAEVTDKDGKALLSQINPSGSEQTINGKPPFSVAIGHTSGVRLYYKGQTVDLAPHTKAEVAHLTLE